MKKKDEKTDTPYQIPLLGVPVGPHGGIIVDPLGSYTGRPWNEESIPEEMLEMPVQDADDL